MTPTGPSLCSFHPKDPLACASPLSCLCQSAGSVACLCAITFALPRCKCAVTYYRVVGSSASRQREGYVAGTARGRAKPFTHGGLSQSPLAFQYKGGERSSTVPAAAATSGSLRVGKVGCCVVLETNHVCLQDALHHRVEQLRSRESRAAKLRDGTADGAAGVDELESSAATGCSQ